MSISIRDKIKDTAVLRLIPSPKKIQVKLANVKIPVENPINLLGHNRPSKYPTTFLVANINM